jgi:hypothetical protein
VHFFSFTGITVTIVLALIAGGRVWQALAQPLPLMPLWLFPRQMFNFKTL